MQSRPPEGSAEAVVCDIADSKALAAAIEQSADKHGRLDVLVNNAGITKRRPDPAHGR